MPIYEYAFGVYVKADDEQAAWERVRPISEALDEIDYEGGAAVEGPFEVSKSVMRQIRMDGTRRVSNS